ncbi:glycosyl transferase [Pantoea sp. FN0307]|uniref:glycosyl transferase n=1 Tax=Pantoea sp. FN0307 TaxID=3418560 RepID=UPI003CE7EA13
MFDVLYIPYRDVYFWNDFGSAVRDLQFLEILNEIGEIDKITILNRPVSLYERLYNKNKPANRYPGNDVLDYTKYDIFGPLKKRKWTEYCYQKYVIKFIEDFIKDPSRQEKKLLIIDFTPIAKIPVVTNSRLFYWYDMIDNFAKHNCYSLDEIALVKEKYQHVANNYDFITAVSDAAAKEIKSAKGVENYVITNGVFNTRFKPDNFAKDENQDSRTYDLGFTGFVTDKFDVNFVSKLAQSYSIVIYGEVYNELTAKKLTQAGITLKGKFRYVDLPNILKTFKVGLLPYLAEKSHDGSPLKMYEYLKFNKPCLTSIDYEYASNYVYNYNDKIFTNKIVDDFIYCSGDERISSLLPEHAYLGMKIKSFFHTMIMVKD